MSPNDVTEHSKNRAYHTESIARSVVVEPFCQMLPQKETIRRKKKICAIEADKVENDDSDFAIAAVMIKYESTLETDNEDILLNIDSVDDQEKTMYNIELNGSKTAMKPNTKNQVNVLSMKALK